MTKKIMERQDGIRNATQRLRRANRTYRFLIFKTNKHSRWNNRGCGEKRWTRKQEIQANTSDIGNQSCNSSTQNRVISTKRKTEKRKEIRHAPSLPNSSVHSAFLFRSSWLIVGLELRTDFTKSLSTSGGSRSWSASTLTQDISIAPWSPGEHGVSFSAPSNKTCMSLLVSCKWLVTGYRWDIPSCSVLRFGSCESVAWEHLGQQYWYHYQNSLRSYQPMSGNLLVSFRMVFGRQISWTSSFARWHREG